MNIKKFGAVILAIMTLAWSIPVLAQCRSDRRISDWQFSGSCRGQYLYLPNAEVTGNVKVIVYVLMEDV